MLIEAGSKEMVLITVTGPAGVDLTVYDAELALTAEGTYPAEGDWLDATWLDGQVALLVDAAVMTPGVYVARVRLTAGSEKPVMRSGRVTVGTASP